MNSQENGLSDVSLDNVEALASDNHPLGGCRKDSGWCCLYYPLIGEQDCTSEGWQWWN